jgi:flavodoxin
MKIEVRCYSRGGGTAKIANAIADEAGCLVNMMDDKLDGAVDLMFLGSGVYAGKMGRPVYEFIEKLSAEYTGKIILFATATSIESALKTCQTVAALLREKGFNVDEESFQCPGKFLLANRSRPDQGDIGHAASFAKKMMQK